MLIFFISLLTFIVSVKFKCKNAVMFILQDLLFRRRIVAQDQHDNNYIVYQYLLLIFRMIEYLAYYGIALANFITDDSSIDGYKIFIFSLGLIVNLLYFIEMIHELRWSFIVFSWIGFQPHYVPTTSTLKKSNCSGWSSIVCCCFNRRYYK